MLIIIINLLFCVAQKVGSEASAFFVGMETNAAILALSSFVLIVFRAWSGARLRGATRRVTVDNSYR